MIDISFTRNFKYSRLWTSAADFPTYEEDEATVRADMQALFDEILAFLNRHIAEDRAENVPFSRTTSTLAADNVRDALEEVFTIAKEASAGTIVDGSVTAAKLSDGAVVTAKLADASVTDAKLSGSIDAGRLTGSLPAGMIPTVDTAGIVDGAVTNAKLADSAVDEYKLADDAVKERHIAAGEVKDYHITSVSASKVSGTVASASSAAAAAKLNTDAGTLTRPVYFSGGVPAACTYGLNATVPAGAKFTDTTYGAATASTPGLVRMSAGTADPADAVSSPAENQLYFKLIS